MRQVGHDGRLLKSTSNRWRFLVWHSGSRGLPEGSWRCLPRRCCKRKQRGRHARKPSPLDDFRPIAQRSAALEDRSEAGHWEGDLIIGANNRSAVATLVERFSRQTLAVLLPDGYDAQSTAAAVSAALRRQPRHLVKTLTWDQGREMARWQDIEAATGAEVYFCEPRQRPTNEQTNGLLRRWLPKGSNLNIGQVRLIRDSTPSHGCSPLPRSTSPHANTLTTDARAQSRTTTIRGRVCV